MAMYGQREAREGSGETCPPGCYRAALIGLFDLGNQPGFKPEDSPQHKVVMIWQVDATDSKGRQFTMFDPVAAYISAPGDKKKSKFAERIEALLGTPLLEEDALRGVDDKAILGKSCQIVVAPSGGKYPKVNTAFGLMGKPPMAGITVLTEETMPKHVAGFVTKARAKAVGGWKPPSPTPTAKSAATAAGGGALPSQEKPEWPAPGSDGSGIPF